MTYKRRKAFIGAVVGAGVGLAKGVAGIISKKKQAEKETQQNYLNAVLQAQQSETQNLNNAEDLANEFESKYVMKCGGRKRSACGKAVKMACGGKKACGGRKKAKLGEGIEAPALEAPSIGDLTPDASIDSLNSDLQNFNNGLGSSSSTIKPSPSTGGLYKPTNIGTTANTAGKIESVLGTLGSVAGGIGSMTGKFKCGGRSKKACGGRSKSACGGRKKASLGFGMAMQAGESLGNIGKAFVKGAQQTEAPTISTRTQGLTNLNQPGTTNVANVGANVQPNTNPSSTVQNSTIQPQQNQLVKPAEAKFGTRRRRCSIGVRQAYNNRI